MKNLFNNVLEISKSLTDQKLSNPLKPKDLKKEFDLKLNEEGVSEKDLEKVIKGVFENSVNTQNPRFLNQLFGGTQEVTWLGELMGAVLNTSMATYEIAPLFTLMEKELIKAINDQIKFKAVDGLMVPGGSYANMMGVHVARYANDSGVKTKGNCSHKRYKVYVSEEAHYSTSKALDLLGLGTDALVKIKSDKNKKMCVKSLEEQIEVDLSNNKDPLCIVSTAGTTVWGSYDPIEEINVLCKKYKIWHHVDAAWGGLVLWSDKKDQLFKGIEDADSVTMDFHKLMASSVTKAFFITKNPEALHGANSGGGAKYIFHNDGEDGNLDTGVYALQCGRKNDALPLWLQWKHQGTAKFKTKVSELYETASWCVDYINSNPKKYKLMLEPEFMNICFQILPEGKDVNIGEFNRALREKLMKRGKFMVNFSSCKENGVFFRLVLNHWGVSIDILKDLFEELSGIAKELSDN